MNFSSLDWHASDFELAWQEIQAHDSKDGEEENDLLCELHDELEELTTRLNDTSHESK